MRQIQGLPELVVTLGRRRLSPAEVATVATVRVRLVLGRPAQCELTWQVPSGVVAAGVDPGCGDALKVEVGGHRQPLFSGEITVVERAYAPDAAREVRVRAYDGLHRLRKRSAVRLHEVEDLAGLARALAEGTGLTVVGGAVRLGRVYQCARSDLDVLTEVAARAGLFPVVDGDALRLVGLDGDGEPVELVLGENLHAAELEVSQEPAYREVTAVRWDAAGAGAGQGSARGRGARAGVAADPAPQSVGGGGLLTLADEVLPDDDLAVALARAELDSRSAAEVSAELVAEGDPALRPGRRVRVAGVAASLEGSYTVTEALHVLDATGYETTVCTRPPGAPPARRPDRVTLGVVDRVDDPQDRGRVVVRLVAYPELVTDWAPVLTAAAGDGKGVVALPAEGDSVLVLLPGTDPAQAVVLGGLYGERRTPDAGVPGARGGRFALHTADGQQVLLDGSAHTLTLADGRGSSVVLGPDGVTLRAAADLVIEAPGRALRLRARTVDFEEAP